jgi:SH3 domain protein
MEALGTSNDFTHVRTASGLEGWIATQYLVQEPIARVQLVAANNRIQALERQLAQRGDALTELRSSSTEAASNSDRLAAQVAQLEAELAELKSVSSGAIDEHARNQELANLNARLRSEVDDLTQESQRLESSTEQRWLLIGGALVLGGLVAGVAIKARPRRSGWS